jgi:membrane protein YqaA with SNARE-associated domain
MPLAIWIMLAVCLLLGGLLSWAIGRFLSRALLRGLWLAMIISFVWVLWPAIELRMGWREGNGFEGVAEVFLAVFFILPTFMASVLGGLLGLRHKARSLAE